jgi:hypothetical protein
MQNARIFRIRLAIAQRQFSFQDAFSVLDSNKTGVLSAGKLWAGLDFLGVPCTASTIVDFLKTGDADGDGSIGWGDFWTMLLGHNDELLAIDRAVFSPAQGPLFGFIDVDTEHLRLEPHGDGEVRRPHGVS